MDRRSVVMAVATSASVSQLTAAVSRSSFVKGTVSVSSSNGLRLSPSVSFGVGNGCSRITAMATKKVTAKPKFSGKKSWLPGVKSGGDLVDPEWLDGSYVTGSLSLSLSLSLCPFCAVGSLFLCFCLFVILVYSKSFAFPHCVFCFLWGLCLDSGVHLLTKCVRTWWQSARRLRIWSPWSGQGPRSAQVVQGSGANPRTMGHDCRGGDIRRPSLEWCAVVRSRSWPRRCGSFLIRNSSGNTAAPDGLGGEQEMGRLCEPRDTSFGVGHSMVQNSRKFQQHYRTTRLPGRQVLRPTGLGRRYPRRLLHSRPNQAREVAAGWDQARQACHGSNAHLLLWGRTRLDPSWCPWIVKLKYNYFYWLCSSSG